MQSIGRWLSVLLIIVASGQAPAAPQCRDIFSRSREKIVASWFASKTTPPARDNILLRIRERRLLSKLEDPAMANAAYRLWWVDQLVQLKISQRMSLLDRFELTKSGRQKSVEKLVLRSIAERGLKQYLADSPLPTERSLTRQIKVLASSALRNPLFKLLIKWNLPENARLSEEQLSLILERGASAFSENPVLARMVNKQTLRDRAQLAITVSMGALSLFTVAKVEMDVIPKLIQAYDQSVTKASGEATNSFKAAVAKSATMSPDDTVLLLASQNIQIVSHEFRTRYGENPTKAEQQEIRTSICKVELHAALTEAGMQRCLAL